MPQINGISNKWTMASQGYKYLCYLGRGQHLLKKMFMEGVGSEEVWFANKNHASYGLIFKNTHLEFAHSYPMSYKEVKYL